jgi:hypothetical protein
MVRNHVSQQGEITPISSGKFKLSLAAKRLDARHLATIAIQSQLSPII